MNAQKEAESYFEALAETLCEKGEALEVTPSGVSVLSEGREIAVYNYKQLKGDPTSHYAIMAAKRGRDFSVTPQRA